MQMDGGYPGYPVVQEMGGFGWTPQREFRDINSDRAQYGQTIFTVCGKELGFRHKSF